MSIGRYASYNFIGAVVPVALALFTVPVYLELVGAERYGILSIAWLLLGYFGLFDLGLSRATAQRIAAQRDAPEADRARTLWNALALNAAMGIVGAVILLLVGRWYFSSLFEVDEALRPEILAAVPILALSVPVATMTAVMVGALQARERFFDANRISVTNTVLFQLVPLAVAWINGPELFWLLGAALAARLLGLVLFWMSCNAHVVRGHRFRLDRVQMIGLLKFGGWVTVGSIFGPLLVLSDRFAIGAVLGAASVAIYTVPFQLANRLAIFPGALGNAVFPRLSAADPDEERRLATSASRALGSIITLPVAIGIYLMPPFLDLWVGREIGSQSAPIGQILLLAFWFNALSVIPLLRLQARERPDLVTKALMAEIPFYLPALFFGLSFGGLVGGAIAFAARCAADFVLLSALAMGRLPAFRLIFANLLILLGALAAATILVERSAGWWASAAAFALAAAGLGWWKAPPEARRFVSGLLARIRRYRAAESIN